MLTEILIDDATWDSASRERRAEWRLALDELLADHRFEVQPPAPLRMLVTSIPARCIVLDVRTTDGRDFVCLELSIDELGAILDEYLGICRELGQLGLGDNSPRLEALDIAKRLTHDEAAERLQGLCRPLRPDHGTCRRLFSLIVALHFDTTLLRAHPRRPT